MRAVCHIAYRRPRMAASLRSSQKFQWPELAAGRRAHETVVGASLYGHAASARGFHSTGATLGITSTQPINPMTLATPATTNADT